MRISDWSSDVCSSDLHHVLVGQSRVRHDREDLGRLADALLHRLVPLVDGAVVAPVVENVEHDRSETGVARVVARHQAARAAERIGRRSDKRSGGKGGGDSVRSRWWPLTSKKK